MRAYTFVHIDVCVLIIDLTSHQQQRHQQETVANTKRAAQAKINDGSLLLLK